MDENSTNGNILVIEGKKIKRDFLSIRRLKRKESNSKIILYMIDVIERNQINKEELRVLEKTTIESDSLVVLLLI